MCAHRYRVQTSGYQWRKGKKEEQDKHKEKKEEQDIRKRKETNV